MRAVRLGLILLPLGWAVACGGRYQRDAPDGDPDPGGPGSSTSGRGGSDGSGMNAPGGRPSSAGGPATGECACDDSECGLDEIAVPNPNGCCSTCVLDRQACVERQATYAVYRDQLMQENVSAGCSVDQDCVVFDDLTGCNPTCSFSIPRSARRGIDDRLYLFASQSCNPACPPPDPPLCLPRLTATCVMGRCL